MTEPAPLETPDGKPVRTIGAYSLIAELARGGMGRVYLARRAAEAGFERLFAIKVMHHHMAENAEAVLMVLDEAHIASRLHHPNVVSVIDIGTYEGGYYLVMDYVEGCSLNDLLSKNRGPRDARLIAPIMIDALRGLHAAHTLKDTDGTPFNVVHRDISPHNLMIGLDGTCRVTDFGIAKAAARFSGATQVGTRKGKIAYMPPEQIVGDTDVDRRADIWACGVTFYYALTGVHPFRGPSEPTTIHNVIAKMVRPPSEISPETPKCFDEVILKALERDPDKRYSTAREMGDAIRQIAMEERVLGAPSDVAVWVEETFGEQIAERRRGIGSHKARTSISHSSLPILGPLSLTPSAEIVLPTEHGPGPGVDVEVDVEPTSKSNVTPRAAEVKPEKSDRARLAVIASIAAAVVIAIALAIALPSEDETEPAPTASEPRVAATEEDPEPPPQPEEPAAIEAAQEAEEGEGEGEGEVAEPAPAEPADETAEAGESAEESADEPPERAPRPRQRPRPRPNAQRAEPAPQPQPQLPPQTEAPTPTKRTLERNPYLRRE